jgi:hypothetical protein
METFSNAILEFLFPNDPMRNLFAMAYIILGAIVGFLAGTLGYHRHFSREPCGFWQSVLRKSNHSQTEKTSAPFVTNELPPTRKTPILSSTIHGMRVNILDRHDGEIMITLRPK